MFYLCVLICIWFGLFQVVRLLYHLVKFGYYMDSEDVQNLLPPLLNLLDGRHDFPYPRDKEKEKGTYFNIFKPYKAYNIHITSIVFTKACYICCF